MRGLTCSLTENSLGTKALGGKLAIGGVCVYVCVCVCMCVYVCVSVWEGGGVGGECTQTIH